MLDPFGGSGTTLVQALEGGHAATGVDIAPFNCLRMGRPVRRPPDVTALERAGLSLVERLRRHVNRRTGRRAGEFFEDVLIARPA